jgi:DNA-directed RNA polymerase II subunit RPB2
MSINGDKARELARSLIDRYFRTMSYPYTKHHIDSYDQFIQKDLISFIQSQNPITNFKDLIDDKTRTYRYKVEVYVGGQDGTTIEIGTPTVSLQNTEEVRLLFPNEARLRNLTYSSTVYADILVKITYSEKTPQGAIVSKDISPELFTKFPLFKIPIMLHSRYCILNNKPKEFLQEAGECPYDHGGYFIIDGAEKVLITRQEQAFNTLYITPQERDPKIRTYATISCLSPKTRIVKRISFSILRNNETIHIVLPFVRKSIPIFILFRALGFESDEEIIRFIFPDMESDEAKFLMQKLHPSIVEAHPFLNTYTSIQYIKLLTKGFSEAHVLDIIRNQFFIHMSNDPTTQATFLGECVRRILRVDEGFDKKTDKDDTRNQRCLVSGFLIQQLFNNVYKLWTKAILLSIDEEYNYHKNTSYKGENFKNIFLPGNLANIFRQNFITEGIMSGFKGKWGTGLGEEKSGVLQALSRLSYVDFMSHCRRVILDFDTGMKLTGPRHLHPSQFGYFCTSETPTGASIGITKNLSIMTAISTATDETKLIKWLQTRGRVYLPGDLIDDQRATYVPVYINGGMFGYTAKPQLLTAVLRTMKRSGCLPYSVSITFSIRDRRVQIYMDAGRPLRPLIWMPTGTNNELPIQKLVSLKTWRDLVMGTLPETALANLDSSEFYDPLEQTENVSLENYMEILSKHTGCIEYVDPYEHNEAYIANYPEYVRPETTHIEVHPSTILSLMTSVIPFPHHNQSPRNQLSCSQSKQGLSIYATNWRNRFDNTSHILTYGEAPISRTMYMNYLAEGRLPYGMNCILAIACWSGYNQEDGIVMNYDALQRGMFRSTTFRSYEAFEEDDELSKTRTRFGNPTLVQGWKDIRPGLDYSKLDDHGFIKEGEYVDQNTVIVGAYMMTQSGSMNDVSVTPQVWTRGRVEKVAVMYNNLGLRLIKIRVIQDRVPELGDKFCLTPDHDVYTRNRGWIPIQQINMADEVATLNQYSTDVEYYKPKNILQFDHEGEMYEIWTNVGLSQVVSEDHRVVISDINAKPIFITASKLYELYQNGMKNMRLICGGTTSNRFTYINIHSVIKIPKNSSGTIHCISIINETFLVRHHSNIELRSWTGNSNRHGQKGTIGALLRAHDMPRTKDGIVPDMIMNPHAIPSRMTIGQNLEQLLGKAAALSGAIGDATAFMNDGSPEEAIGKVLEEGYGFEKYGNEILYNGATGEQIPTAIFIGPVYGMRLKHMVEDKWQARGKGRREQRTHQPTGGRGNEGGLKIGEQERDAIVAHGIAGFTRESFMNRSDGTTMSICKSCGTIPIYNPKLSIAVCPLCDGPVKYIGDNVQNLEILPPLGRTKSEIVEVEMPYATKLLAQELETFLNIGMRVITTADVMRLQRLELSATGTEVIKELPNLILPETSVPEMISQPTTTTITLDQLKTMQTEIKQLKDIQILQEQIDRGAVDETIYETENADELEEINDTPGTDTTEGMEGQEQDIQGISENSGDVAKIQPVVSYPQNTEATAEQLANMSYQSQENQILQEQPISSILPATINIDTSPETMVQSGLVPPAQAQMGGMRRLRRGYGGMNSSMNQSSPMSPGGMVHDVDDNGNPIPFNKNAPKVFVNKSG